MGSRHQDQLGSSFRIIGRSDGLELISSAQCLQACLNFGHSWLSFGFGLGGDFSKVWKAARIRGLGCGSEKSAKQNPQAHKGDDPRSDIAGYIRVEQEGKSNDRHNATCDKHPPHLGIARIYIQQW
jgi:hypothetical protein